MRRRAGTLAGLAAIALWSSLAILTVRTAPVPPMQILAMAFAIGAGLGFAWAGATGGLGAQARVPPGALAFGTLGLFGYHALYVSALRQAPAAEASLIAYLWPLLIVLLSGLLPGERLRAGHVAGAALGFAGTAILLLGSGGARAPAGAWSGYALALSAAVVWALYSVGLRRLAAVSSASVAIVCAISAVLSLGLHLALEETAWPAGPWGWAAVAALGVGPMGAAFYAWDAGMKHGHIQTLGTASYAAPVLSTLLLVAAGAAAASWRLAIAAGLVAAGAAFAARAGRQGDRGPRRGAPSPGATGLKAGVKAPPPDGGRGAGAPPTRPGDG